VYVPLSVNVGAGPTTQGAASFVPKLTPQFDKAGQREAVVIEVPILKPGTRVETKTVTTRNGRVR
jgi:hypothetical protein